VKRQLAENISKVFESEDGSEAAEREAELLKKIGELTVERDFLGSSRARSTSVKTRRALVEPNDSPSMRRQCELLGINRSSLYYKPVEPDEETLALMRQIDELHLKHPFFGSRMMTQTLKVKGHDINRKRTSPVRRPAW